MAAVVDPDLLVAARDLYGDELVEDALYRMRWWQVDCPGLGAPMCSHRLARILMGWEPLPAGTGR